MKTNRLQEIKIAKILGVQEMNVKYTPKYTETFTRSIPKSLQVGLIGKFLNQFKLMISVNVKSTELVSKYINFNDDEFNNNKIK